MKSLSFLLYRYHDLLRPIPSTRVRWPAWIRYFIKAKCALPLVGSSSINRQGKPLTKASNVSTVAGHERMLTTCGL